MRSVAELQKIVDGAVVARNVFDLRPDYLALLIAVDGITPSPSDSTSESLLGSAERAAKSRLSSTAVTEIPQIKAWRDAYKSFGAKPKKYQSSIEALTRRVPAGLPRVNRLTDIYNGVSVLHNLPLGGEDLDAYIGAPRLMRATGNEEFETKTGVERPEVGEVVWCDDGGGLTCRNWNWRQCVRTQLKEETTSALFILDALAPVGRDEVERAGEELVKALREGSEGLVVAKRVLGKEDASDV